MELETDGFRISSNFDSGNLLHVEKVEPGTVHFDNQGADDLCAHEFSCWVKPDCAGTEYENNNRTWFHFSLSGGPPFATVRFNIMNMNRQGKLYAQGMKTVYKVEPLFPQWKRLSDTHLYKVGEEGNFIVSFKYYTLEDARCITYFAFSFPYSYTELQTELNARDLAFRLSPPVGVYYHRELITYSLDGRRVDLLTITADDGGDGREVRLPGLFPLAGTEPRAVRFPGRKVVLLSARVHPGETPSSHVLDGCVRFLLNLQNTSADRLRRLFVFKVIPMLNPDGVARGHYRTNIHGTNLNRMYSDPARALYPEIYAAKSVALYHHLGRVPADCELLDSEPSVAEVDAQFVRPRDLTWTVNMTPGGVSTAADVPVRPPRPEIEDVSNDASCIAGDTDEYSLGMPDLSPLKSLLQLTPRRTAAETNLPAVRQAELAGSDSESLVSSADADPASVASSCSSVTGGGRISAAEPMGTALNAATSPPLPRPPLTATTMAESNLFLYVDMHGHASKRGCFMYGNHFSDEEMVSCMLLPKLVSVNSPNFDFLACNFTEKNMHHKGKRDGLSKEGSGRVALYRATGLVRSYTLECNYNTGRFCNVLPPSPGQPDLPNNVPLVYEPVPYTPAEYREVGEAMMISLLDLVGENPQSRLPRSEYRDLEGVRAWIRRFMHVTRFGENNMTFSPEKTARTMKSHTADRLRQANVAGDEKASVGRPGGSPAGGAAMRRQPTLAPSAAAAGVDTKEKRRPSRRLRRSKAKKLTPGKVEDQENALVTPARHKRSADALLAAAANKADTQTAVPETTSLAGPSRLRVKSPVLQPRLGQLASPGHAPPGLSRPPTVRRALSEKRRVLKPSPVRLGDGASLNTTSNTTSAGVRRSASLVSAANLAPEDGADARQANVTSAWSEQLQLTAGGSGTAKPPGKRAVKRKKRPAAAAAGADAAVVRVEESLPACRSLGHLIQLVSTPPVTFSSLFPSSASASQLESGSPAAVAAVAGGGGAATAAGASAWAGRAAAGVGGGAAAGTSAWAGRAAAGVGGAATAASASTWASRTAAGVGGGAAAGTSAWAVCSQPDLLQDEAASLPETVDVKSADASPLSFAGALSSASNSPRAVSPRSPGGSKHPAPAADSPSTASSDSPRTGGGNSPSSRSPPSFGQHQSAPASPQDTATISTSTLASGCVSPAPQPPPQLQGSRRVNVSKARAGTARVRCTTRRSAKKPAKTLRAKRSPPLAGEAAEVDPSAKPARTKLARRASAPLCRAEHVISALDLLEPSAGLRHSDVTPAQQSDVTSRVKSVKTRLKKSRSSTATTTGGVEPSCSRSVSCGTWQPTSAPVESSSSGRRSASEGGSPAQSSAVVTATVTSVAQPGAATGHSQHRPKARLVKRGVIERARGALQPARKRKRAKDKT